MKVSYKDSNGMWASVDIVDGDECKICDGGIIEKNPWNKFIKKVKEGNKQ